MAANTVASDFSGSDLIAGEKLMSVYLTVAPANLDLLRPREPEPGLRCRLPDGGRGREGAAAPSPDEIRRLPADEALIYVAGCAPIRGQRVPYWRDGRPAARAAVPPPEASDRVARAAASFS